MELKLKNLAALKTDILVKVGGGNKVQLLGLHHLTYILGKKHFREVPVSLFHNWLKILG